MMMPTADHTDTVRLQTKKKTDEHKI